MRNELVFSLLHDLAAFHVEAFFACFAHREGFARQGTVQNDGFEEVAFVHAWQVDARVACLTSQAADDVFTVDIIDAFCFAGFQPAIKEVLDGANRQVEGRVGDECHLEACGRYETDGLFAA